jgi:hypothetical protein
MSSNSLTRDEQKYVTQLIIPEFLPLLSYYAAQVGLKSTFWGYLSVPSSWVKFLYFLTLEMELLGNPETSVLNQFTSRNNQNARRISWVGYVERMEDSRMPKRVMRDKNLRQERKG